MAWACLARAAQAKNDLGTAGKFVEEIMSYLADGSLDGTWEPLRIYLTCYQILLASEDDRVGEILETAYQELQVRARKIPDGKARRMFHENVPWHRAIIAIYQEKTRGD
ncbi:MAG TPA: hypothetical protein VFI27_06405 [candidate division Zixibacteria bacterium]|nr:hypothetical protein [candidate division Zixibacteria bacterium]